MNREPTITQRLFADALRHHQAGRLAEAEGLYRQILTQDKRHAASLHLLGLLASQNGRPAEAVELIGNAIAIEEKAALYHASLGNVLCDLGRFEEAVVRYARAVELGPDDAEAHHSLGNALTAQGKFEEAAACYERALARDPKHADAHSNLGNVRKSQGRVDEAIACYERAIALRPDFAAAHSNLGNAREIQGKLDAAAACYARAIALRPDFAEAHYNLGVVRGGQGHLDDAAAAYAQAIALKPDFAEAHYNLGNVRKGQGRPDRAAACYARAIALRPDYAEARYNLAMARSEQGEFADAISHFEQVIALRPDHAEAHTGLANALASLGKFDQAAQSYERAVAVNADFADAYIGLGNIKLSRGEVAEAHRLYHHAQRLRPLKKRAAIKPKPDFSVLLLTAPGAVNTPSAYLFDRGGYDSYSVILTPADAPDVTLLQDKSDVVVNLISDADEGRETLPAAIDLVERLGRPVINHPRKVLTTSREQIAARLAGIPLCRIPTTIRLRGEFLVASDTREALADFAYPLLVRLSGRHGGSDFEKCADPDAVAAFVARRPEAEYYVSEYVPYESADGYFRKYRLICVDGQVFPYHLAIHDHWKVHHFRTAMTAHAWMRSEEEAFVKNADVAFSAAHAEAFRAIHAAVDLDFFGIDCGLDRAGHIVVFEVNATMRVHDEHGIFAYKASAIARIKSAFDAMLAKAARSSVIGPALA